MARLHIRLVCQQREHTLTCPHCCSKPPRLPPSPTPPGVPGGSFCGRAKPPIRIGSFCGPGMPRSINWLGLSTAHQRRPNRALPLTSARTAGQSQHEYHQTHRIRGVAGMQQGSGPKHYTRQRVSCTEHRVSSANVGQTEQPRPPPGALIPATSQLQ